jgi:hypothetical protein
MLFELIPHYKKIEKERCWTQKQTEWTNKRIRPAFIRNCKDMPRHMSFLLSRRSILANVPGARNDPRRWVRDCGEGGHTMKQISFIGVWPGWCTLLRGPSLSMNLYFHNPPLHRNLAEVSSSLARTHCHPSSRTRLRTPLDTSCTAQSTLPSPLSRLFP